jgi:hypothetical protein
MARPQPGDYAPFYHNYVMQVSEEDALAALQNSMPPLQAFLSTIPAGKAGFAYAPGKWTVAQLLQHMIDAERVFAYRAMCMARGEQQNLPSFDENAYADNAPASHRPLGDLADELMLLRKASEVMFAGFTAEELGRSGFASGKPITVNAIGFIIAGHVLHHQKILAEKYL